MLIEDFFDSTTAYILWQDVELLVSFNKIQHFDDSRMVYIWKCVVFILLKFCESFVEPAKFVLADLFHID